MKNANLWLFTEEPAVTPNRKRIDEAKESSCRKQDVDFIQETGGSLKASRRVINIAIVYMHRIYVTRAFTDAYTNGIIHFMACPRRLPPAQQRKGGKTVPNIRSQVYEKCVK
ncbi:hypothetical protein TNIN_476021 [Trichonephila inaurata madagascariensis]|uniref:Uncharacterized protein n=1 Tax=Trichonephila inaurata madagascariensis TaxID=2747483 RepID=A0A8X6JQJ7_9ARAC|nr:hypothetical protein TNIN_476021 [Trichonephila inaurata madagascariensis]